MKQSDETGQLQPSARRLRVLGPVLAWHQQRRAELGPPLQRAVLCILAAQAGQVVSKEQLIGGLWRERVPKTAEQSIYTYVAGLRRALEPDRGPREPFQLLVNRPGGYALQRGRFHIDAEEFEDRIAETRRLLTKGDRRGSLRELETALRLWTGPALSGIPGPFAEAERARLEELRLITVEDRADILLGLGRHQEALPALHDLVGEHPLRERARELLMLALYRSGRQADSLAAYLDIRHLLAERLGVDPGESLQRRYHAILRSGPTLDSADPDQGQIRLGSRSPLHTGDPEAPVPRQLPRAMDGFVGRTDESVRLRSLLAPGESAPPQAVVAITGPAGVGKSAMAVQSAHAVGDHFPDGLLYANLLGATPGVERLKPIDLLGRFLRALGVRAEAVPHEVDEAAAMLRDTLAGRRVLAVLDDASGPDQVRPLLDLPSGNAVLITSRESFAAVDNCAQVRLGMMVRSEAVTMLAKLIGAGRVAANPAVAARLVDLCDGLPLALRLAAARLIDRPHWGVRHLVERLEDRGRILHELESGDIAVRSSLELSHDTLSRSSRPLDRLAARTLCHLGILHVPDVTSHVVAALLDASVDQAERSLERLTEAHLLESHEFGRFQLHDLVRLFAMELAEDHLTHETRSGALSRALGLYGVTARLATRLVDPHRVQPPWPHTGPQPAPLSSNQDGHAWMERERANVLAAASQAMSAPDDSVASMGAYVGFSLMWHLYRAGHRNENLRTNQQALEAGQRLGNQEIMALAHGYVAMTLTRMGQAAEALPHQLAELELQRGLRNRFEEMRALGNLSVAYLNLERYADALECSEIQFAIARDIGADVGQRHALSMLGCAHRGLGNLSEAGATLSEAVSLSRAAGDQFHVSHTLRCLAEVRLDQNDPLSAKTLLEEAFAIGREIRNHDAAPWCLTHLATANRLLGQFESAVAYATEAVAVARAINDKRREEMAAWELSTAQEALAAGAQGQEEVDPVGHR
ncbi:BTAD domain-containing putative transcriptional regulator [Sphaerimonospora cavernae]|uniref:BTAD domain-containing putative transcriptional regulator n=1 Tax=Sphaerimonospora cavernae TaxID=1740611 RepID=A0ABV6TY78_9ACTN